MTWLEQHEPRFQAILEQIRAAGDDLTVLDVGAEPYQLTNRILGLENVSEVSALTLDREGSEPTERLENGTITVYTGNVEEPWPVEQNQFDVIVMGAILEHLFEPAFALHQGRMAAVHAGRLVVSTPNGVRLKVRVETALGISPFDGFDIHGTIYDRHQHEYTRDELKSLLESVGWNVIGSVRGVNLSRSGLAGSIYETVARGDFVDQWIVSAHAGRKRAGKPTVYRDSLVNR